MGNLTVGRLPFTIRLLVLAEENALSSFAKVASAPNPMNFNDTPWESAFVVYTVPSGISSESFRQYRIVFFRDFSTIF